MTNTDHLPDEYLQKEYELRISYLKDHFTRMWTRFNFFLTINTGLLALSFGAAPSSHLMLAGVFGLTMCICWNHFAATDNYLVKVYRTQIAHAYYLLTQGAKFSALKARELPPALASWTYTGHVLETCFDPEDKSVKPIEKNWAHRYIAGFSATELGVVVSALYALAWIALLLVKIRTLP
jgi:hypothetical protein